MRSGVLGDTLVEFADATRIWLDVRDGATALRGLAGPPANSSISDGWTLCFGCCWYQLHFSGSGGVGPTVRARVKQRATKRRWARRAGSSRWYRKGRERRQ